MSDLFGSSGENKNKRKSLKNKFFRLRFVAFVAGAATILLRKTIHNSERKEAFAKAKAMVIIMKNKIFTLVLIALLACVLVFASCNDETPTTTPTGTPATATPSKAPTTDTQPSELDDARSYITSMYKDKSEITAADYDLIGSVSINGKSFEVVWTVKIESGPEDGVTIEKKEDGNYTVKIGEKLAEDCKYEITATIKDNDGNTAQKSFKHTAPQFRELSWKEYYDAKAGDPVVVKGVVTAILSKANGNKNNCIYLQDNDGGYYVYALADDPTEKGIKVGMTIRASGEKDIYSGTHEIKNAGIEIIDENITATAAKDITEIYSKAETLKDTALTDLQSMLVTIKGVTISAQDDSVSNGYYKFKLGSLESYIRISSSDCPLAAADQTTFKNSHKEHTAWLANATGIVTIYNNAIYLTPASADAYEYLSLPERTDAEKVAMEKDLITLESEINASKVITVPVTGKVFDGVKITWTSDNAAVVADNTKGTLTVTLPSTDTTVKVTATITSGSTSDKVEFTVKLVTKIVYTSVKDALSAKDGTNLYIKGKIIDFYTNGETYGNVYISDDDGATKILIYGLYDQDGKRYDKMTTKPVVGDTITIYGPVSVYNSVNQIKNATLLSIEGGSSVDPQPGEKPTFVTAPKAGESYTFAIYQANLKKTIYFSGAMSGYYIGSVDSKDSSPKVTLEAAEGGYYLAFTVNGAKKYIDCEVSGTHKNIIIADAPSKVWSFNSTIGGFTADIDGNGTIVAIGTYSSYNTFSVSDIAKYTDDTSKIDVDQFPARLIAG